MGMQTGLDGLKRNALNLPSKEAMAAQGAPVKELVEMKMNQYQVLASGKVIETVDEILGSLFRQKNLKYTMPKA
ncbi:MAG: hypothetical protein LC437_05185 [Thiohalomonas sp.]|nr:hypothetical protein [Thiohalomonas sp.]